MGAVSNEPEPGTPKGKRLEFRLLSVVTSSDGNLKHVHFGSVLIARTESLDKDWWQRGRSDVCASVAVIGLVVDDPDSKLFSILRVFNIIQPSQTGGAEICLPVLHCHLLQGFGYLPKSFAVV